MKFPGNDRLTFEQVDSVLALDRETGVLTWRVSRGPVKAGAVAGHPDKDGYLQVGLFGSVYGVARIVWLLTYRQWPDHLVNHRDRSVDRNAPDNLRAATPSGSAANRSIFRSNRSGVRGVCWSTADKAWLVQVYAGGRRVFRKCFKSKDEAASEYARVALIHHGDFANPERTDHHG